MTHPLTEMNIKQHILDLVRREFASVLESPIREFPLPALGSTFKADFACKIKNGGWCFIEDDSSGTCLSNLLKYSAWIDEANPERPIWVFHIISPEHSGWIELCRREGKRLNSIIQGFTHIIITTPDWPENDQKWLDSLRCKMKEML